MSGSGGVRVPVQADATGITTALNQIREALRAAGQEAAKLSEIDLSHPELQSVAQDLQKVRDNVNDLQRLGRGSTAATARRLLEQGDGSLFGQQGLFTDLHKVFPDRGDQSKFVENAGRYITQGTSFQPQFPERAPRPAGKSKGGGSGATAAAAEEGEAALGGMGGLLGELGGGLVGGAGFFLAAAGLSGIKSLATKAGGLAGQEESDTDRLMRTLHETSQSFEELRDHVAKMSEGLAMTDAQMQAFSATWGQITADTDPNRVLQGVRDAAGFARGYGQDKDQTVNAFARASVQGLSPQDFASLIGETVAQSGAAGQSGETMSALLRYMENTSRQQAGATGADQMAGFSSMYADMFRSGNPGLRGQNGVALMSQIDSTLSQGGGAGMAGRAAMFNIMSTNGVRDPFQQEYVRERGAFAQLPSGKSLLEATEEYVDRTMHGASQYQRLEAGSRMLGINQHQYEAITTMQRMANTGNGRAELERYGIGRDQKIDATGYAEIFDVIHGSDADRAGIKKRMLDRPSYLSDSESAQLQRATGDDATKLMAQLLAAHGETQNQGSIHDDATSNLTLEMMKTGRVIATLTDKTQELTVATLGLLSEYAQHWGDDADKILRKARESEDQKEQGRVAQGNMPDSARTSGHDGTGADPVAFAGMTGIAADSMAGVISGIENAAGDPNARNPAGSAAGLFQYTGDTFLAHIRAMAKTNPAVAERISGLTDEQIKALRTDPKLSAQVMTWAVPNVYDHDLRSYDLPVNAENEYLEHHFGEKGAAAILRSPADLSMREAIGEKAYAVNPDVQGRTVGSYLKEERARVQAEVQRRHLAPAASVGAGTVPPEAERRNVNDIHQVAGHVDVHLTVNGQPQAKPIRAPIKSTDAPSPPQAGGGAPARPDATSPKAPGAAAPVLASAPTY